MVTKVDKEFFDSYVNSVNTLADCEQAYSDVYKEAYAFLQMVRKRQSAEAVKISEMVTSLDTEENEIRATIRRQAAAYGESLLEGNPVTKADDTAAASLAAIPEEKAALLDLRSRKRMTASECETWESLISSLHDTANALSAARRARERETNKLREYARSVEYWASSVMSANYEALLDSAYELNSDAE